MNRRGFGLFAFLGILFFLGICLLVSFVHYKKLFFFKEYRVSYQTISSVGPKRMGNDYHDVNASVTEYYFLEKQLENGAREYIKNYPIEKETKLIITIQALFTKKIIEKLYDSKGNMCKGYIIYDSTKNYYTPYLNCGNYKSKDYIGYLE